ncbi:hypothetical protein ACQJBY_037426 [Aegilops geniculata]
MASSRHCESDNLCKKGPHYLMKIQISGARRRQGTTTTTTTMRTACPQCTGTTNSSTVSPLSGAGVLLHKNLWRGKNGRKRCPGGTRGFQERHQKKVIAPPLVFPEAWR